MGRGIGDLPARRPDCETTEARERTGRASRQRAYTPIVR